MTENLVFLFGAAVSLFLIGANIAFLLNLGNRLTRWFTFKIAAVTLLLAYVCLSLTFGNPAEWRAAIALSALVVDVGALCWMWYSITKMEGSRIQGLIPLGKIPPRSEDKLPDNASV